MQTKEPTCYINCNLPLSLVERLKAEARNRSVRECRHIPYTHVLRDMLEQALPAAAGEPELATKAQ
jgi:hypothetical protein